MAWQDLLQVHPLGFGREVAFVDDEQRTYRQPDHAQEPILMEESPGPKSGDDHDRHSYEEEVEHSPPVTFRRRYQSRCSVRKEFAW